MSTCVEVNAAMARMREKASRGDPMKKVDVMLVCDTIAQLERQLAAAERERDVLRRYRADVANAVHAALCERCDSNEHHCSCVPLLRTRIKHLQAVMDAAEAFVIDPPARIADEMFFHSLWNKSPYIRHTNLPPTVRDCRALVKAYREALEAMKETH